MTDLALVVIEHDKSISDLPGSVALVLAVQSIQAELGVRGYSGWLFSQSIHSTMPRLITYSALQFEFGQRL